MVGRTAAGNLFNLPWCASLTSVCFLPSLSFLPFHPLRFILPDLLLLLSNFPFRSSSCAPSSHPKLESFDDPNSYSSFRSTLLLFSFIYGKKQLVVSVEGKLSTKGKVFPRFLEISFLIPRHSTMDELKFDETFLSRSRTIFEIWRGFFFLWLSILIRVDTTSKYV